MNVIVVIGDIVGSSGYPHREELQERLKDVLQSVNSVEKQASLFTISAGDEVEAVYTRGETVLLDILSILSCIHPATMRFSIALGTLTTKLDPQNPLTADGPVFHIARKTLNEMKTTKERLRVSAGLDVDISFEDNAVRLLALHIAQWREKRWEVYREYSRGLQVAEVSEKVHISQVAVYKNIRAGAIDLTIGLAADIGKALTIKL